MEEETLETTQTIKTYIVDEWDNFSDNIIF